jgi:hypothetical protein
MGPVRWKVKPSCVEGALDCGVHIAFALGPGAPLLAKALQFVVEDLAVLVRGQEVSIAIWLIQVLGPKPSRSSTFHLRGMKKGEMLGRVGASMSSRT